MSNSSKSATAAEQQLIELLRANPKIFVHHPELLDSMVLADSRGTASLLERQIKTLKDRLDEYYSQHEELLQVARENEQISDNLSHILCQLIGYSNLSEFAGEFPLALRKTFIIDEVAIKTHRGIEQRPSDRNEYNEALRRLQHKHAVCDDRWPSNILALFFSSDIRSAALIPMLNKEADIIGILALGAHDESRYQHGLATDHLDRLGVMAGVCLQRLQR